MLFLCTCFDVVPHIHRILNQKKDIIHKSQELCWISGSEKTSKMLLTDTPGPKALSRVTVHMLIQRVDCKDVQQNKDGYLEKA